MSKGRCRQFDSVSTRRWLVFIRGLLVCAFIAGWSRGPVSAHPRAQANPLLPVPDHVVLVMEENQDFAAVFNSPAAPYLNTLARQGAVFTNSHALTHPSQPNYLDLFAGSDQGLTDDSCPHQYSSPNLASALIAAGHTFVGYSEDLPAAGAQNCTAGLYARKHAPWVNFTNVSRTASQPWSAFPTDYSRLPTIAVVVPNLNHDMHNGSIRSGDSWLQQHLDAYVQWAHSHNSLLIVQWDEDSGTDVNHILTLFVGPMVAPGQYAERITHLTLLRTLEDRYALPAAGRSSTSAPITDVWTKTGQTFAETGHAVQGQFWAYWQAHGGLPQFGYPLSEEITEHDPAGRPIRVQYFERAVLEYHAENAPPYDLLLRLLGTTQYAARYPHGAPGQVPNTAQGRTFLETGHTLGGGFRAYWDTHGGLAQLGYPLSDEFREISLDDGQPYIVQYFERAVFEYHPANPAAFQILLRRLGSTPTPNHF